MVNAHALQQKYKSCFELPKNSVPKHNTKTEIQQRQVVKLTHMPLKTLKWAYSGLENKLQNASRNIYGC